MYCSSKQFNRIAFWSGLIGMIAIISDFGYTQTATHQQFIDGFYFLVLAVGLVSTLIRYRQRSSPIRRKILIFDLLSVLFTLWIFHMYLFVGTPFDTDLLLENPIWIKIAVLLSFVREFSELSIKLSKTWLNPAQIFILSFLVIIFTGSLLLALPNATHEGITYLDALFTSTSAVCVTGLTVVDTGTHFTLFGQTIIMILIQLGGLGILTFASYFGYFFKGGTTYENQLTLSDITSSKNWARYFQH